MTEFELHQLIIASRAEFDTATVVVFTINLVFCVIALWKVEQLDTSQIRALSFIHLTMTILFTMRAISAIVRFGWLNLELNELDEIFNPTMPFMQIPTVIFRAAVLFAGTYFTWSMIRKTKQVQA